MDVKIPNDYDGPIHTVISPSGKKVVLPPGSAPFIGKVNIEGEEVSEKAIFKKIVETSSGVLKDSNKKDEKWADIGKDLKTKSKQIPIEKYITQEEEKERKKNEPYDPVPKAIIKVTDKEDSIKEEKENLEAPRMEHDPITEVEISAEEILSFYDNCIMRREAFTKTYVIKAPPGRKDTKVILRTRTGEEASKILDVLGKSENAGVNIIRIMNDYNLAASLVKIGGDTFDSGLSLEERVFVIEKMPGPFKAILWEFIANFDNVVEKIRRTHVNF